MYEKFLANVQMLEGLTKAQRARIIDALEEITFSPGESIIKEGEAGAYLYIIVQESRPSLAAVPIAWQPRPLY